MFARPINDSVSAPLLLTSHCFRTHRSHGGIRHKEPEVRGPKDRYFSISAFRHFRIQSSSINYPASGNQYLQRSFI